jgi:hypothetical protein
MIAGATSTPTVAGTPFDQLAISLGAVSAYPYSGQSLVGSAFTLAGAVAGDVALQALRDAIAGSASPIDVIAYSGGAQAFVTAFSQLSAAEQSQIGSITYIVPATICATLPTTQNPINTVVYVTPGWKTQFGIALTNLPPGVATFDVACDHGDFACLANAIQSRVKDLSANGPCAKQDVFTRPVSGAGGSPFSPMYGPIMVGGMFDFGFDAALSASVWLWEDNGEDDDVPDIRFLHRRL